MMLYFEELLDEKLAKYNMITTTSLYKWCHAQYNKDIDEKNSTSRLVWNRNDL